MIYLYILLFVLYFENVPKPVLAMNGKRVEEEFMFLSFPKMYKNFYGVIMFIRCHTYLLMFIDLH